MCPSIADDGTATQWYDGQIDNAGVRDASFAADGRSVWILLDQVQGDDHTAVIAKSDERGEVRVVATAALGSGVAHMWIGGVAQDDSSIAINHWLGELGGTTTDGPTVLVSATGAVTTVPTGTFIGFMPGSPSSTVTESSPGPTIAPTD